MCMCNFGWSLPLNTCCYIEPIEPIEVNKIKEEKQVAVFQSVIRQENYTLLRNLLSLVKPTEKTLKELMEILQRHFEPQKVVMAAHYQFHQHQQQPGESVSTYLAELRKMAVSSEFGASLSESVRDHLVCGLRSEAHQKCLLSESELTLDKVLMMPRVWKLRI